MPWVYDIRWIDLDGVVNMRDVGGMPTRDGGVISPGRLLRSDNLQDLTEESVRTLLGPLQVTDVVDLRSFVELEREGPSPLTGRPEVRISHFTMYAADAHHSALPPGERELPWQTAARERGWLPQGQDQPHPDHDKHWSRHYLGYLGERPDSIVAAMRTIASARGATVVHCAAGKDRTGTVTGLSLLVAGAEPEAVVTDFAASALRVPQILERLSRRPAYAADMVGKTVAEQSPRPETMRPLLQTLDETYGGVLGWLDRHGWTDADTARLTDRLRG